MKRVLIYPICFISTCAIAKTTFYYETGGQCPVNTGLFLNPNATSCSEAVTKVTTPTASGRSFAGFWVGSTQVIDSNGNILVNSSTAPNLFDSSAETNNAQAVYTGTNTITVRESNYWVDEDKYIGWYTCADFGYHMCQTDGAYVAPPAGLCHSYGVNPNTNGYDYKFNSWVLGANHNIFVPASCYNGLSETCPRQDGCWCNHYSNGEIASGNSSKPGACTESMLGPFEAVRGKFSLQNVYPFACKRFYVNGTWTDEVDVVNGKIILDNSTPGQCRYHLTCNEGYHSGSNGSDGHACEGVACKGFFNGNYQELGITAPCVKNTPTTCPTMQNPDNGSIDQPTPNNGQCDYTVTCNNSSNDFGYACDTTTGLCTKSCTVGSDCNNLKSQYTGAQHQLCKRCPTVEELNMQSALNDRHIEMSFLSFTYNSKHCNYHFGCQEGYTADYGLDFNCRLDLDNCTTESALGYLDYDNYQCTLACPTVEQLGIGDDLAFAHLQVTAEYTEQDSTCNYRISCADGCTGNFNTATFNCAPNTNCNRESFISWLGTKRCACASDCPDVYAEDGLNLGATLAEVNMDGQFYQIDTDERCTYRFSCLTPYTNDWNNNTAVLGCDLSNNSCSQAHFNNLLTSHACTFECPSVASLNLDDELAAHHATLSGPTIVNDYTCDYQLSCNNGYSGSNSQTIGCIGLSCKRQTILNYINSFQCNYECPAMPDIWYGSINLQNQNAPCNYNVTCDNTQYGYSCREDLGLCNTRCVTQEECTELYNTYNSYNNFDVYGNGVCQKCPGPHFAGLEITDELESLNMDVEIESFTVDEIHSTCTYKFYCKNNPNNIKRVGCFLNQGGCTRENVWVFRMNSGSDLHCD